MHTRVRVGRNESARHKGAPSLGPLAYTTKQKKSPEAKRPAGRATFSGQTKQPKTRRFKKFAPRQPAKHLHAAHPPPQNERKPIARESTGPKAKEARLVGWGEVIFNTRDSYRVLTPRQPMGWAAQRCWARPKGSPQAWRCCSRRCRCCCPPCPRWPASSAPAPPEDWFVGWTKRARGGGDKEAQMLCVRMYVRLPRIVP